MPQRPGYANYYRPKDDGREQLCTKCGQCCLARVSFYDKNGTIVIVTDPAIGCKYLSDDRSCSVYERRFDPDIDMPCLPIDIAVERFPEQIPQGCPYLPTDFSGAIMPKDETEFWDIMTVAGADPLEVLSYRQKMLESGLWRQM
ncbi:hypothetical protein FWG95_03510 [Candidatus Saccharibacteria bacterium]|nr:hypothetical protein [Candidatus Saccharibacteria bacterium]